MAYLAHAATLNKPLGEGTFRDSFEVRLRQARKHYGVDSLEYAQALADLEGPEPPESLWYLKEWSDELLGRCGVTAEGVAPLDWVNFDAWARRKRVDPEPHEIDALFELDAVRRHPPTDDEEGED